MPFEGFYKTRRFFSQAVGVLHSIRAGSAITMLLASFLAVCVSHPVQAETAIVSTFAQLECPSGIVIDTAGNLYVKERCDHAHEGILEVYIHKITPKGEVSIFVSSGEYSLNNCDRIADGERVNWHLLGFGIAIDAAGNLYVANGSSDSNRIRKVTPKGKITSLAGGGKCPGFADGKGSAARFNRLAGIAIDTAGNLYAADAWNNRIRKITPKGKVSTLAGSEEGFADGRGSSARFNVPHDIAIDAAGNLYVADMYNRSIRKVTPEGEVTTLAGNRDKWGVEGFADEQGSAAGFDSPFGITVDAAGNLYVVDHSRIRKVTPEGKVSTLAGSRNEKGFVDGEGRTARFFRLGGGIAVDAAGNLYVVDHTRIRKIVIQRP